MDRLMLSDSGGKASGLGWGHNLAYLLRIQVGYLHTTTGIISSTLQREMVDMSHWKRILVGRSLLHVCRQAAVQRRLSSCRFRYAQSRKNGLLGSLWSNKDTGVVESLEAGTGDP